MDKSFLSNAQLIKVSREFVCVRTATYEDKQEAKFLKWAFLRNASDDLRNFGFCILSPDGQQKIRRSFRGPNYLYKNSDAMTADLRLIARQYSKQTTSRESHATVPQMKSVRLAINVASCDGLPSVIVVGHDQRELDQLHKQLSDVIWDDALAGKFIYASTTKRSDLNMVPGAQSKSGFLVIEPDTYGTRGRLLDTIPSSASSVDLEQRLTRAANTFTRNSKSHGLHVRNGRRSGKQWQTEVPVPDRVRFRTRSTQGQRRRP